MPQEWLQRWREGRIGFHRSETHPALIKYWETLAVPVGAKVLVPLCGKSLDMRWLASQGHPVLGIELAPEAIEQFLAEGEGDVSRYRQGYFRVYRQASVELWCGDFFHVHVEQAKEFQAFYDRAALIALPPATRQRYALHLAQLLPPGARGLLVTLTHPGGPDAGPPFSVDEEEVRRLLAANFELMLLETSPPDERGFGEQVWSLCRRGPGRVGVAD
ncbi:thiopurine S-methyltransferase [Halomonas sp. McH1-25]|uniref:thiopurine S-methyltransferase n=1 Tax=unclassified Halomonas TaxID=2609666 RepID=UPI001EF3F95F|nr:MULTISPECIES: thiopurine S-methyltransferase [unclassified Halomonas]MCG7602002.1 thiopurine S-methyltransferase [Halomonas sp. McH1-25]MCP1341557.1 thiopurine S-methyltransferase [Halomonas sp. FL8]MCP1360203.1 thiopurine S-methyltransferase [Halomonas sp. BBD45]